MVQSQMTKADLPAGAIRWRHVADLHLAIADDNPVDQELDEGSSLLECRPGQPLPDPLAEVLDGVGKPAELLLPVCLRFELSCLLPQLPLAVLKVTPPPPVFVQTHHTGEISLGQPLELLLQACLPTPQSLLAGLEFLRQPLSTMRPRQSVRNLLWMAQQVTQIGPDQLIQALG